MTKDMMPLIVQTARIGCRDADALDVTRKSATVGLPFAPSWEILRPALNARAHADTYRRAGETRTADRIEAAAWERYVPAYTAEMRASYRANRAVWDALLARDRVVLLCYCTDPARCHRTLLGRILTKLGADFRGELSTGSVSMGQTPEAP